MEKKPGQPRVGSTSEPTPLPEPTALAHALIVSAREVNGSRFGVGSDTLLAGANYSLPYKHFGSPSWINSVKARQLEHARTLMARAKGSKFFSHINAPLYS